MRAWVLPANVHALTVLSMTFATTGTAHCNTMPGTVRDPRRRWIDVRVRLQLRVRLLVHIRLLVRVCVLHSQRSKHRDRHHRIHVVISLKKTELALTFPPLGALGVFATRVPTRGAVCRRHRKRTTATSISLNCCTRPQGTVNGKIICIEGTSNV